MIATAVSNWREVVTDFEYTFNNIDTFIAAGRESKALGLMNTVWSDSSQSLMRAAWPAIAYGAVASWQSLPVDRTQYFQDYCELMYTGSAAAEVAVALDRLSKSELQLQKALGQETMHTFWDDPFEPNTLKRLAEHREDLRQTRLLAEESQERLYEALSLKCDATALRSLMIGARMLDYAGMKFLNAIEAADRWKEMGPTVKTETWWNRFESEWTYQSHGRPVDLMDQISELRKLYRAAWLEEYTPYRLASTLGRWDAEYEYWRRFQASMRSFSRKLQDGDPLPPIEQMVHGR